MGVKILCNKFRVTRKFSLQLLFSTKFQFLAVQTVINKTHQHAHTFTQTKRHTETYNIYNFKFYPAKKNKITAFFSITLMPFYE